MTYESLMLTLRAWSVLGFVILILMRGHFGRWSREKSIAIVVLLGPICWFLLVVALALYIPEKKHE